MRGTNGNSTQRDRFPRWWVVAQPVVAAYIFAAVRSRADAEDLLQDVAATAFEQIDRFDPTASFTGWTLGIARHAVLNHHRSTPRGQRLFGEKTLQMIAEAHQRAESDFGPRGEALEHCIGRLPQRHRLALMLRYRDDLQIAEVASRMALSSNAAAILLHRVRQALADCINRRTDSEAVHE